MRKKSKSKRDRKNVNDGNCEAEKARQSKKARKLPVNTTVNANASANANAKASDSPRQPFPTLEEWTIDNKILQGIVRNHPDVSIQDGSSISIQKFTVVAADTTSKDNANDNVNANQNWSHETATNNTTNNAPMIQQLQNGTIIATRRNGRRYILGKRKKQDNKHINDNDATLGQLEQLEENNSTNDNHNHNDATNNKCIASKSETATSSTNIKDLAEYVISELLPSHHPTKNDAAINTKTMKWYHDYSSPTATYQRNSIYAKHAPIHLSNTLPFLSLYGSSALLNKFNGRYYLTFMFILDKLKQGCDEAIQHNTVDPGTIFLKYTAKRASSLPTNTTENSTSITSLSSSSSSCSSSIATKKKSWNQDELNCYYYSNITNLRRGHHLLPEQTEILENSVDDNSNLKLNTASEVMTSKDKKVTLQTPVVLKQPTFGKRYDSILRDEIDFTIEKYKEWIVEVIYSYFRQREKLLTATPATATATTATTANNDTTSSITRQSQQQSNVKTKTVECNCCFVESIIDNMVHCINEGHLFCIDCVQKHAKEQIFGQGKLIGLDQNNHQRTGNLACMYLGGCNSYFARSALVKALPMKIIQKFDELQTSQALEMSGVVKDLCQCPKCGFQALLPETEEIFECPVESCQYQSCRKCGEKAHFPLSCEEIEKKDETSARLRVEEAMTNAKVRYCPKGCKQPFFKTEGCNKMTCPGCSTYICYICREIIPRDLGYTHFCRTPFCTHETCQKCPLHSSDTEADDRKAAKEAGLKMVKQIQAENNERGGGMNANNCARIRRIDVEAMLQNSNSKVAKVAAARNVQRRRRPTGVKKASSRGEIRLEQMANRFFERMMNKEN